MSPWGETKRRADGYMDAVLGNLGGLWRAGDLSEDRYENTDLRLRCDRSPTVSVHVRFPETWQRAWSDPWCERWLREITIRVERPSGVATELEKIAAGLGTHLFYGLGNKDGRTLYSWILLDLAEFRARAGDVIQTGTSLSNRDASSSFIAIDSWLLDPACVVAASGRHPWHARPRVHHFEAMQ